MTLTTTIVVSIFVVAFALTLNLITLRNYKKNFYYRSYYGEKLLMRDNLCEIQREYIEYVVKHREGAISMLRLTVRLPLFVLKLLTGKLDHEPPAPILELWKDETFDKFMKSDIKIWFARHPTLTSILFIEAFILFMVAGVLITMSKLIRGRRPSRISMLINGTVSDSVEIVHENRSYHEFNSKTLKAA